MSVQVYLSRRNLLTLLSKLDRKKAGEETACTLGKHDTLHPLYAQSHQNISVTAVEDEDYYASRPPGMVHPKDTPQPIQEDLT
jgi:hypothetical protein